MPKRSEIWNHFNSIDSVKAKCRYCHEIVSFTSGSTSNLFRHMKRKHPISFNKRKNTEQSTEEIPVKKSHLTSIDTQNLSSLPSTSLASIHSEVADVAPLSSSAHKAPVIQKSLTDFVEVIKPLHPSKSKEIDEQLLKMIVKEYHPFSIVEDQEFRKLIKLLCPSYNVPSRKYISNSLLPMIYKREESKLKSKFNEVNAVCLTTDCWTSVNNESFIAITAHYIDQNTNLQTHLLKCTSYSERHTANNLASHLQSTVQEWELTNKVTAVVTDNGANIVSAVKQCNWRHISCFAHSMNLVVHSGIAEIRVTTDKIKALVEYFKRSSHSLTKLHNTQTQMGFPKLKLKQDVPTRWNSTFIMFDRVLKTKQPLIATIALLNLQGEHNITTIDWEILESAVQLLQIFNEITDEVSSENYITISKIIIFSRFMTDHVSKFLHTNYRPEIQSMARVICANISNRFSNLESVEIIGQSMILDPRFKNEGFSSDVKFRKMYHSLATKLSFIQIPKASLSTDVPSSTTSTSSLWREFDAKIKTLNAKQTPVSASIIELDKYLAEPFLNREANPLDWWRERKDLYPRLYDVVLKRLCIPATSVPCERIFSKAGQILVDRRNRLKSSNVSMILFLNKNLH
ncbi:E3 SUMO-protein ligase ZBED1-like [Rhodnius prolixus]|uniref:E3 SUMO-protein ligase ZBED1-like n=1 Tax=Rhodnius prolixus TaxID=13249 RepID=UPI003D18EAED